MKVSVIMPAYNVEAYIEKSVASVMNQTLNDIELIIVNDASTDNTWDVISNLMKKYGERLKGINLSKNIRQGGARNLGIKEAKGDYIAFVDSDDWIESSMLEKFYTAAKDNDADLVGTSKYYMYFAEDDIQPQEDNRQLALELSGKEINAHNREKLYLCPSSIWRNIFKKQLIMENDIFFPEGVSYEDNYFYNLYLGYVTKYVCVDEAFYYYRQNPSSTVHRKDYSQLKRVEVEKKLLQEYIQRELYPDVKDGFDCACVQRWYINTIGLYFARFGKEGIKLNAQMGKEFRQYFPNYTKNKYYKTAISKKHRIMLRIFEISPSLLYLFYQVKRIIHR